MKRTIRMGVLAGLIALAPTACDKDVTAGADASAATTTTVREEAAEGTDATTDGSDRPVVFESPGMPTPTILTTSCNPADPTDCILPSNYPPADVTGDLRGTSFSSSAVIGRNGVYPGVSLVAFTGEAEGCGTGGLLLTTMGTFDPSTGLTTGEWSLVEDGGTGQLADVAGSGTSTFDATGGHFEGRLRCR